MTQRPPDPRGKGLSLSSSAARAAGVPAAPSTRRPHAGQAGLFLCIDLYLKRLAQGADRFAQPLGMAFFAPLPFSQAEGTAGVLLGDLRTVVQVELSRAETRHAGHLHCIPVRWHRQGRRYHREVLRLTEKVGPEV